MNAGDEAGMRTVLDAPVNPTRGPLLHLVAMFYTGIRGKTVTVATPGT